jgi:hypothetical protein
MINSLRDEVAVLEGQLPVLRTEYDQIEQDTLQERSSRIKNHTFASFWAGLQVKHPMLRATLHASLDEFEYYPKRHLVLLLYSAVLGQLAASVTFAHDDQYITTDVFKEACMANHFTLNDTWNEPNMSVADAAFQDVSFMETWNSTWADGTTRCTCMQQGGSQDCYFLIAKAIMIALVTTLQIVTFDSIFADGAAARQLEHRMELLACEEWMDGTGVKQHRDLRSTIKDEADERADGRTEVEQIVVPEIVGAEEELEKEVEGEVDEEVEGEGDEEEGGEVGALTPISVSAAIVAIENRVTSENRGATFAVCSAVDATSPLPPLDATSPLPPLDATSPLPSREAAKEAEEEEEEEEEAEEKAAKEHKAADEAHGCRSILMVLMLDVCKQIICADETDVDLMSMMEDSNEGLVTGHHDREEAAQALSVKAFVAYKKAESMQAAMKRMGRVMQATHLRSLCISESTGARVAVHLPGVSNPLIGWVESELTSGAHGLLEGDGDDGDDYSGATSTAAHGVQFVVALSQRCPEHIKAHLSKKVASCVGRFEACLRLRGGDDRSGDAFQAAVIRVTVPAHRLVVINKGTAKYLSPRFDHTAQSAGGLGASAVELNRWRWFWLNANLHLRGERPWFHATLFNWFMPSWHEELLNEVSRQAEVIVNTCDVERVSKFTALAKELEEEAAQMEEEEEVMVVNRMAREAEEEWAGMRRKKKSRPFYWYFCCRMKWCRRRMIARDVAQRRQYRRKMRMATALLDTLPRAKKQRLIAERKLAKSLGGLKGMLFSALFGVDRAPDEITEEHVTTENYALCFVWLYIAVLTYYTLAVVLTMKEADAIACMVIWLQAFFSQTALIQPISILITTGIGPFLVAKHYVEPFFEAERKAEEELSQETNDTLNAIFATKGSAATDRLAKPVHDFL